MKKFRYDPCLKDYYETVREINEEVGEILLLNISKD